MVAGDLLLDTHAILWLFDGTPLAPQAMAAIDQDWAAGRALQVSPMSAWEIGMLASKGRIRLSIPPLRWFQSVVETPGVALAPAPIDVLIEASFLPACDLRDPMDQILVATARTFGLVLVTRDGPIRDYAAAGHLRTLIC